MKNRKYLLLFLAITLGLAVLRGFQIFIHQIHEERVESRIYDIYKEESVDPQATRAYLKSIGFNADLPEFTISHHSLRYKDVDFYPREKWEITFSQPLSESFIASLDSLCSSDSKRWRHTTKYVGHGMASHIVPCYEFTYWNPEGTGKNESISIFHRTADISYLKF